MVLAALALLVASGLGWLLREPDGRLFVKEYGLLLSWWALCFYGMVWGAFRVFRAAPNRQGASIAAIIGSTLALVAGPLVFALLSRLVL